MRRFNRRALRIMRLLDLIHPAGLTGYELERITGVRSGSLYPILARLEAEGILIATKGEGEPTPVRYSRAIPIRSLSDA